MRTFIAVVSILGWMVCGSVHAEKTDFKCKVLVEKNNCWQGFDVSIDVVEQFDKKVLKQIKMNKESFDAESFVTCVPNEKFYLSAQFEPTIWEEDKNKTYRSSAVFLFPTAIEDNAEHWQIDVCFPDDFIRVPIPDLPMFDCKCSRKDARENPVIEEEKPKE